MHAAHTQIFEITILLKDALGPLDIDAELGFLFSGGGLRMGPRIDIRVDTQCTDRLFAKFAGDAIDVFNFSFRFKVKSCDADVDRIRDFLVALADAGVDDLFRISPRLHRAEKLTAAGDIKAAAFFAQKLEDIDVAAALDRVADGRVDLGESIAHLAVVMQKRRLGIDIQRRAELSRQLLGGDILAVKFAILVVEKIHSGRGFSLESAVMQLLIGRAASNRQTFAGNREIYLTGELLAFVMVRSMFGRAVCRADSVRSPLPSISQRSDLGFWRRRIL